MKASLLSLDYQQWVTRIAESIDENCWFMGVEAIE
jgi:hypothetical protein